MFSDDSTIVSSILKNEEGVQRYNREFCQMMWGKPPPALGRPKSLWFTPIPSKGRKQRLWNRFLQANNKLDWTDIIKALYRKEQSQVLQHVQHSILYCTHYSVLAHYSLVRKVTSDIGLKLEMMERNRRDKNRNILATPSLFLYFNTFPQWLKQVHNRAIQMNFYIPRYIIECLNFSLLC